MVNVVATVCSQLPKTPLNWEERLFLVSKGLRYEEILMTVLLACIFFTEIPGSRVTLTGEQMLKG
jgi:hypothetical protein